METTIRVEGLRELQKALRQTAEGTPKVIQTAHKAVAEIVVANARGRTSARLAQRIDARGTVKGAAIRFRGHKPRGKARSTDALLQEFGGSVPLFGMKEHWFQVKPVRKGGWIIYPAIKDTRQQVRDAYIAKLDEALRLYWQQRTLGG